MLKHTYRWSFRYKYPSEAIGHAASLIIDQTSINNLILESVNDRPINRLQHTLDLCSR